METQVQYDPQIYDVENRTIYISNIVYVVKKVLTEDIKISGLNSYDAKKLIEEKIREALGAEVEYIYDEYTGWKQIVVNNTRFYMLDGYDMIRIRFGNIKVELVAETFAVIDDNDNIIVYVTKSIEPYSVSF